jgi:hypothetical protein
MYIITIKASMAIMVIITMDNMATMYTITTKASMAIMYTIITKASTAIMDINNKYITTDTTTFIRKLFFIKRTKVNMDIKATTKANNMDIKAITTKANNMDIKAITTTANSMDTKAITTKANNMDTKVTTNNKYITNINNNNINNIYNSNLLLGQVEWEQEEQGQQREQLVLVEQQDTRGTWGINELQKKRHNKKLLGNPSSFFQLLDADVQFQHEVVVPVLASLLALESYRRLHGIEASHQGIVLPCWRCLQFRILYLDVRPFLQTFRMQSK